MTFVKPNCECIKIHFMM